MHRLLPLLAQIETTEPDDAALERFLQDHGLLVGTLLMLLAVALGVSLTYGALIRNRRQRAMASTARRHGLDYSPEDRFGSTQVAFPLFRAGDGRRVANVMGRTAGNGLPIRVFDYSYFDEYEDQNGRQHQRWKHFDCAMARHNGLWPTIRVTRERGIDRVAQKLGLSDVELESEEFNRTFVIQCADRKFATDLLDPQMMAFLLTTEGLVDFETKGRWLLLTTPRLDDPAEMVGLLGVADEFLERIPPVVWDLHAEAPDTVNGRALDDRPDADDLPDLGLLQPLDSVTDALREESADRLRRIEYDLDGHPVTPPEENPWA